MLKNILSLDGAQELSKEQQKVVTGGRRIRNLQGTGGFYSNTSIDGPVACECTWETTSGIFNSGGWVKVTGPCPAGTMESLSCVPE